MKKLLLLALSACALAGNLQAGNTSTVIQSTHAEEDARAYAAAVANEPQTYASLYHRIAMTKPAVSVVERLYKQWLDGQNAKRQPVKLLEGDQLAEVANLYDDEATIRLYLRDSGYNDLSPAQISQIRAYMHKNGIRHVSQIQ
jgi:outer membrane biogenesis lipoprotein LolB